MANSVTLTNRRSRFYSLKEANAYLKDYKPQYVSEPQREDLNIYHRKNTKTWWICTSMEWLHFH